MSPKIRVTLLVTALIAVMIITMGLFFGIMPQRENAAAAQSQRETAEAQNALLQSQLEQLAEDSEALTERREQFARQLQAFPEDNQYASYIDSLDAIAEEQNVDYRVMETGEKLVFDLEASPWQGRGSGEFGNLADDAEPDEAPEAAAPAEDGEQPAVPEEGGTGEAAPSDPFSGRELVAVPVAIEVSGGATGIRHFVRLVQTGDRYTTLTHLQFEAFGEDDEDAPPIGGDDEDDDSGAEPASLSITPLPMSLLPMPNLPEPPDPSTPEQPDADGDDSAAQEDEEDTEEDDEDEEETGGGGPSGSTLDSGPDVLFGETVARIEGYIWILRESDGESSTSDAEEQFDSLPPAEDEGTGNEGGSEEEFEVSL